MNQASEPSNPEVFVLVPSYNHAPFIEKCLKSIVNQTLPPKKLLVIDDGSKDDSVRLIERALKDCPFDAELIARENRGLCATLNQALGLCGEEYFAYISSDDLWLPRFLASRTSLLEKRPAALLAFGHSYLINERDEIFDNTENWGAFADGDVREMLLRPRIPASATVVYRRSTLARVRWNEGSILEDYELYLRLSVLGEFAFDPHVLSAWRIHHYNTSGDFALMMSEWLAAIERNAGELGLDERELADVRRRIEFNSIAEFIRLGQKKRAFAMLRATWRAAGSAKDLGKLGLGLALPTGLIQWRRNLVRRRHIRRNGAIEIG